MILNWQWTWSHHSWPSSTLFCLKRMKCTPYLLDWALCKQRAWNGSFFLCIVESVRSFSDVTEVMISGSSSYVSRLRFETPWLNDKWRKKPFLTHRNLRTSSRLVVEATTRYPACAVQVYSRIYGQLHPLLLLKSLPLQHQLWSLGKMPHSVRILKAMKNVVKTGDVNNGHYTMQWLVTCLVDSY